MKVIAYLRTSTAKRNQTGTDQNGFSFDAQLASIRSYLNTIPNGEIVAIYTEQLSGANNDRPELLRAFSHAKQIGGGCCVCTSKIDRLSRDAAFVIQLSNSGVPFKIAEMPNADHLQLSLMAVIAEQERLAIRSRVKSAMAAAKARGRKFGTKDPVSSVQKMNAGARRAAQEFKNRMKPIIEEIINVGGVKTLAGIANVLNVRGIRSRTGRTFYPTTVKILLG
jgi:DNA invertase Pin-like site-specific DNA recombinase